MHCCSIGGQSMQVKLTIVDIKLNKIVGEPIVLKGSFPQIASTLDGKYAFVARPIEEHFKHYSIEEKKCDIIDIENQKVLGSFDKIKDIHSIQMVPHSINALAFSFDGEIFKLDIKDITDIQIVGDPIKIDWEKTIIAPDGKRALSLGFHSGLLNIIDINNWKIMESLQLEKQSRFMVFADNGKLALVANKNLNIVDVKNQNVLKTLNLPAAINNYVTLQRKVSLLLYALRIIL
jgi:hypothetical protein